MSRYRPPRPAGTPLITPEGEARLRAELPGNRPEAGASGKDVGHWRRNGAGAQLLHDLGYRKLRVLGTPRRQGARAGFGLDVVEHVEIAAAGRPDAIR